MLISYSVRRTIPKHVRVALIRLGIFFRSLCVTVIQLEDIKHLQIEIVKILYQLKRISPFLFPYNVTFTYYLTNKVKLGGPIQYR